MRESLQVIWVVSQTWDRENTMNISALSWWALRYTGYGNLLHRRTYSPVDRRLFLRYFVVRSPGTSNVRVWLNLVEFWAIDEDLNLQPYGLLRVLSFRDYGLCIRIVGIFPNYLLRPRLRVLKINHKMFFLLDRKVSVLAQRMKI